MTTTPGPRTPPIPADGTYDAYMEGFRDGKAEARADVDGLVALLRSLLSDALTVQKTRCDHRGIGKPGCGTCDPRLGRALLAGDKAEAPE